MGMKRSRKTTTLIVVALAAVACLVWLMSQTGEPDEPVGAGVSNTSGSPSFEVQVEKPRMDRFLGGILPTKIESKLLGGGELRFDHASRGAQVGSVGQDRLELRADGWELLVQTDGQGRITPATRLVFPIEIAEKQYTLRCRPADAPTGYLHTTARANSDLLDGRFLVELAACVNAETGKILDTEAGANPGDAWPSSPLTVRGSFNGLPTRPSPESK
ncbi:MAG: hypothetical protein QOD32_3490 [Pyrinomonadaceae bacterium]|jgi:hypothetical protein|nr:hypothetical protein [Pyrinomonadaceae bacterium]